MHLFSRIDGCHFNILGLPLVEITVSPRARDRWSFARRPLR